MSVGKLSDEDVRLIRQLDAERARLREMADALSRARIAEKFDISPSRVFDICQGISYQHVKDE